MTVIKPKRGTTKPTTSDIVSGEVAIDTSAQKLYINDSGIVKEIGGGTSSGGSSDTFDSGTKLLFQQDTSPTGWTKIVDHNDKTLRVVSGNCTNGGNTAFTSAFAVRQLPSIDDATQSGTVGNTTLTADQNAQHVHSQYIRRANGQPGGNPVGFGNVHGGYWTTGYQGNSGNSAAHNHSFTGTAHTHTYSADLDIEVSYVDIILAQKD